MLSFILLNAGIFTGRMGKIKVAVIGCGFIATAEHLPSFKQLEDVEITAVVDIIEERARKAAETFKVSKWYTDYTKVIEMKDIDVVDVCTPTYTHCEITVAALKSGKHVVCEKPIALKLKEADEMINTAKKEGLKFMVAHCLRFWPEYVRVKDLVESGAIGEPRIARAYRQSSFPAWAPWHKKLEMGGGVFIDMSIHDVDFLRWVLGEVEEVYAQGGVLLYKDSTAPDYVHALLKFKSGAIAYVEGSWIMPEGFPFTTYLEIAGTKGLLTVDNHYTASLKVFKKNSCADYTPQTEDAYFLELKHFIECVKEDKEPLVTGEEAKKTLEVVLAALKSLKEGRPVKLPLSEEVIP